MENQFMAIIEQDGEWHIAYCLEIPGTNDQSKTKGAHRDGDGSGDDDAT